MQHGCHNLAKEKQLLKNIKQAEEDKQDLITNAAIKKKNVSKFLSSIEAVRDRIKVRFPLYIHKFLQFIL